jgi:hypothetical protein
LKPREINAKILDSNALISCIMHWLSYPCRNTIAFLQITRPVLQEAIPDIIFSLSTSGVPSQTLLDIDFFRTLDSDPLQSPYKNRVFTCRTQTRRRPIPRRHQIIDAMETDGLVYIKTPALFGWAVLMGVQTSNER